MTKPNDSERAAKATEAVLDRFRSISAALVDISPGSVGIQKRGTFSSDKTLAARYTNRVHALFVLVTHLEDDAKRLAVRRGRSTQLVKDLINGSTSLQLVSRVADSHKHGLGGRKPNVTVLNGILTVVRTDPTANTPGADAEIAQGMMIADAELGVFHSTPVIRNALREWISFFRDELGLDLSEWEKDNLPSRSTEEIRLSHAGGTAPLGSIVAFEIPDTISIPLQADVKKRSDSM